MMGLFLIDLRAIFDSRAGAPGIPGISDCGHGLWAGRMHRLQQQGDGKDVMAKVNGYKVLRSEVDKTYNSPDRQTCQAESRCSSSSA